MHNSSVPDPKQIQSFIARLDAILAELDKAHLGRPAIDVGSAITKLQRHRSVVPGIPARTLRSTA